MYKLILKFILIGLFAGIVISVSVMMIGAIIYFLFSALDLFLSSLFLEYTAWIALITGAICSLSTYLYVIFLIRKFYKKIIDQYGGKSEK